MSYPRFFSWMSYTWRPCACLVFHDDAHGGHFGLKVRPQPLDLWGFPLWMGKHQGAGKRSTA